MIKKNTAFTLIELLIAIAISGFIIVSMMQGFRNVQKLLLGIRVSLQFNKEVCLFFNQIERDFNTAIIPELSQELKQTDTKKSPSAEATGGKDEGKKEISFFKGESYGEDTRKKIEDKRYELFKYVNFVNTNPLQVWGQKRERLVRINYELIKNKEKSTREEIIYDLFRKETTDIKNEKLKESEETFTKKKKLYLEIRKNLVATNIKEMYIEYVTPKQEDQKKLFETEDNFTRTFNWGLDDKTKNFLPQQLDLYITFWDKQSESEETFQCVIPIVAFPYQKPKEPDKKPADAKAMADKKTDTTTTTTEKQSAKQPPTKLRG